MSAAWESIIQDWERGNHGVLLTENNTNILGDALTLATNQGVAPSREAWLKIVEESKPRLQLNETAVSKPEENIPHEDVPSLRKIRTIEDINALSREQVRAYLQPASRDHGLDRKFAERCSYIKQCGLRRVAKPETTAKPVEDPAVTEARRLVMNLSYKDIGWAGSGMGKGKYEMAEAARRRIGIQLSTMVARLVAPAKILATIKTEIEKLSSCSAR